MYDGSVWVVFFFFQAEDGIRDGHVTGVQTCALPICSELPAPGIGRRTICQPATRREMWLTLRSEERRVGKECRSRWSPYQQKKNTMKTAAETIASGRRTTKPSIAGINRSRTTMSGCSLSFISRVSNPLLAVLFSKQKTAYEMAT